MSKVLTLKKKSNGPKSPLPSKRLVWTKYFGNVFKHHCYCYKTIVLEVLGAWHRAHVIAKSKGGSDHISNLRPICAGCNHEMSTSNMNDFMALRGF